MNLSGKWLICSSLIQVQGFKKWNRGKIRGYPKIKSIWPSFTLGPIHFKNFEKIAKNNIKTRNTILRIKNLKFCYISLLTINYSCHRHSFTNQYRTTNHSRVELNCTVNHRIFIFCKKWKLIFFFFFLSK